MAMSYMDLWPPKRELDWKFPFCFGTHCILFFLAKSSPYFRKNERAGRFDNILCSALPFGAGGELRFVSVALR